MTAHSLIHFLYPMTAHLKTTNTRSERTQKESNEVRSPLHSQMSLLNTNTLSSVIGINTFTKCTYSFFFFFFFNHMLMSMECLKHIETLVDWPVIVLMLEFIHILQFKGNLNRAQKSSNTCHKLKMGPLLHKPCKGLQVLQKQKTC